MMTTVFLGNPTSLLYPWAGICQFMNLKRTRTDCPHDDSSLLNNINKTMIWYSNRLHTRYCNVYNSVENPVVTHEICEGNRYSRNDRNIQVPKI